VRQRKQTLDLAVVMCPGAVLRVEDLGPEVVRYPDPPVSQGDDGPAARPATLHEVERRHIQLVLERTGWRIKGPAGAAVLLGLSPASLHFRLKKLGIRRSPAPVS
jgi:DNA-binding NtrC family response regulator